VNEVSVVKFFYRDFYLKERLVVFKCALRVPYYETMDKLNKWKDPQLMVSVEEIYSTLTLREIMPNRARKETIVLDKVDGLREAHKKLEE